MLHIQRFTVNPFAENCYVASDETGEAVIIDCGVLYSEERQALLQHISDKALKPRHLIATHAHVDHNFGNDTVFDAYGLKPEVHMADEKLMGSLAQQAMAFCGMTLNATMPPIGRLLADGDEIAFGTHKLTVVSTPGHSPGSIFLVCKEEDVAFSGDTLFAMSIGRTDLAGGSYTDIMASLTRISRLLPPSMTILPGHGEQTTMQRELRSNPFLKASEKE